MNQQLFNNLKSLSLVEGEMPKRELESPWYIKLLLSVSGWFGAFFLVIFIGGLVALASNMKDELFIVLIPIGAVLIFVANEMFKGKQSDFSEHFFLAISVAGQALMVIPFVYLSNHAIGNEVYLVVALFQAFLLWVTANYIHRMMSSFFMALSLGFYFLTLSLLSLFLTALTFVVVWLYLNEFSFKNIKKFQAIAYGLLAGLIYIEFAFFFNITMLDFYYYETNINTIINIPPIVIALFETAILLYVIWKILGNQKKKSNKKVVIFSFVSAILFGLLSVPVYGLLVSVTLLLVGFSSSHRLLMGVGVASSLAFIATYYYFMGETLMEKAGALALVGVGLLLARYVLKKVMGEAQNV